MRENLPPAETLIINDIINTWHQVLSLKSAWLFYRYLQVTVPDKSVSFHWTIKDNDDKNQAIAMCYRQSGSKDYLTLTMIPQMFYKHWNEKT